MQSLDATAERESAEFAHRHVYWLKHFGVLCVKTVYRFTCTVIMYILPPCIGLFAYMVYNSFGSFGSLLIERGHSVTQDGQF